jgi:hypothetical protein
MMQIVGKMMQKSTKVVLCDTKVWHVHWKVLQIVTKMVQESDFPSWSIRLSLIIIGFFLSRQDIHRHEGDA